MSAQVIDGKKLSKSIQSDIAQEVAKLKKDKGIVPGLAAILVGEHEASKIYVRNKEAACKKAGMFAEQYNLPATVTEEELLHLIHTLNHDPHIHSILVQLPLPKQIQEQKTLEALLPEKDVDGFHPVNMGNLLIGRPTVAPCTRSASSGYWNRSIARSRERMRSCWVVRILSANRRPFF